MTLTDIANQRMFNQQFVKSKFQSATELVGWFGAVQAQEYAQSKWGLGLRLGHLVDKDVEQEFAEGKILRTHILRPTWHFVTAQDIRWMLMISAPRVHQANAFMYRKYELTSALFNQCNALIIDTLQGGKCLTRDAINKEFAKNNISVEGIRLSYIMMAAELDGLICSGPRQGNQFTYALLDERVSADESVSSRDEALFELARRYFTSRGPATINDFATWSGLTLADCRKGVQLTGSALIQNVVDQTVYYSADTAGNEPVGIGMHLLPLYDEWIMGYKDRSASLAFRNHLLPIPPFRFGNVILAEGQIIGTWKRSAGSNMMVIEADFFSLLSERQRSEFETIVQRLEQFINRPVQYKLIG